MRPDVLRDLEQLESLFNRAPVALGIHDRELRFVRVNDALAALNGMAVEEHLGRTLGDFRPEAAALVEPIQRRVMETGEPFIDFAFTVDHAALGSRHWIAGYHPLHNDEGEVVGVGAIAVDVTERHELEERLRRAERLEAIGALAGGVAHDFNNVLTAILGSAELLGMSLDENDPRQREVEDIRRAAQRAAGLTQQLLAFGGRQALRTEVLDVGAAIRDSGDLLRCICGPGVGLDIELWPEPLHVQADPTRFEQVLVNLAANARDAMPKGGGFSLSVAAESDDRVRIVARDNGVGIPAEDLSRVFEPFFTTKGAGKGTGLGLASVYGIVTQSGGTIDVESTPGESTTFTIRLPRVAARDEVHVPAVEQAPLRTGGGAERILLVEDEDAVRTLAERVLTTRGYAVHVARDGEDALDILEQVGAVDLVVTDVVMPRMSGPELADALAAQRPDTKVLFMSGYTGRAEALAPFLAKPFTPDLLSDAVRSALDAAA